MRKAMMWVKMALFIPMIWLTALQSRKESFATRFFIVKKWANLFNKMAGIQVETIGLDNVPENQTVYFVSNHQGSLDPFLLLDKIPTPVTMVSKESNAKIPVLGSWMKTLEMITLDRSNLRGALQMVKDVAAKLKNGTSVVIFPEGTRSKCSTMGEFKAGALKPAYMALCAIIPVTLVNSFAIDAKGKQDMHVKVIFDQPIPYEAFQDLTTVELAEQIKAIIQNNLDGGVIKCDSLTSSKKSETMVH